MPRDIPENARILLEYNPETGIFTRRITVGSFKAGEIAGSVRSDGYRQISIDDCLYLASRLAMYFVTGEDPGDVIDHKNRVRDDNRFNNLRKADKSHNGANSNLNSNNTSGFKGVTWVGGRWKAQIKVNGINKHLGYYAEKEKAAEAYSIAANRAWGEFSQ
jgi:hypothetical protein